MFIIRIIPKLTYWFDQELGLHAAGVFFLLEKIAFIHEVV